MRPTYLHSRVPGLRCQIVRGPWVGDLGNELVIVDELDVNDLPLTQTQVAVKYLYLPEEFGKRTLITECTKCGKIYRSVVPHGLCSTCDKRWEELLQIDLFDPEKDAKNDETYLESLRQKHEQELRASIEKRYAVRTPSVVVGRLFRRMQREAALLREQLMEKIAARGDLYGAFYPENEQEVIWLFSRIADALGYHCRRLKIAYPDGLFVDDTGATILIEFEHRSGNFIDHHHNPDLADLVVCWQQDKELPIPVLALSQFYDIPTGAWNFDGAGLLAGSTNA